MIITTLRMVTIMLDTLILMFFLEEDTTNETNVDKFLGSVSLEDAARLDVIKSSFPCWLTLEKTKSPSLKITLKIVKVCVISLLLYLVILPIVYVIGHATPFSFCFLKQRAPKV